MFDSHRPSIIGIAVVGTSVQIPVIIRSAFGSLSANNKVADLVPFLFVHGLPVLGAFLTVALVVPESKGFPDNWIYVHSPEVELGRIQNFGSWSPYLEVGIGPYAEVFTKAPVKLGNVLFWTMLLIMFMPGIVVLLPLYVREALWINLDSAEPVAVQIATGGVCIASGRPLKDRLTRRPQNYVVLPEQPWVDGFKTASGEVRQFVGVSKGSGLSVEQQLTGSDDVGGIQIQVWRLTPAALKRWKAQQRRTAHISYAMSHPMLVESTMLGVGAGGRIRQEIYRDPFTKDDWQRTPAARCWSSRWMTPTRAPRCARCSSRRRSAIFSS